MTTNPSTWPNAWPNSYINEVQAIHIPEGTRFGMLTVIKRAPNIGNNRAMLCKCDCGNDKVVQARYLRLDKVMSCGCKKASRTPDGHKKSEHPYYQIWKNMINRTTNRRHLGYPACGGVGIRVCSRWLESFDDFLTDIGPRPPRTVLVRVNKMKDYTPENTRWLTPMQQRALHNPPIRMSQDDRALACAL